MFVAVEGNWKRPGREVEMGFKVVIEDEDEGGEREDDGESEVRVCY